MKVIRTGEESSRLLHNMQPVLSSRGGFTPGLAFLWLIMALTKKWVTNFCSYMLLGLRDTHLHAAG